MSTTMHLIAQKRQITFDYRVFSMQFDTERAPWTLKPGAVIPLSMVVSYTAAAGWEAVVHYVTADENGPVRTRFYSEHRDTLLRVGGRVAEALSEVTEGAWPASDEDDDVPDAGPDVTVAPVSLGSEYAPSVSTEAGAWPKGTGPGGPVEPARDSFLLGDGGASS